jgi:CRISPR-associated endoribonuclease Cas6
MPAVVTVHLNPSVPFFFDEALPLEELFLEILEKSRPDSPAAGGRGSEFKPYTLSPIWRSPGRRAPDEEMLQDTECQWRVCLLDDALTPHFLEGLKAAGALNLEGNGLAIGQAEVEERSYQHIARQAQEETCAGPDRARHFGLEFITPVVLRRHGLPMPLPDPLLLFRHYLSCWDAFAPRELSVNVNLLDAIEVHLALAEHSLETRRVRLGDGSKVGFLGKATYTAVAWEKLGVEFLGTLHMLADFATLCGSGEWTARGLGQTRYSKGRVRE